MTNEYNFKVGDIVRLKNNVVVTITAFTANGDYLVRCPHSETIYCASEKDIKEVVTLYDRRTTFLTRLQSLMREFDAEICYREGDCELHIDLGDGNRFDRISYPFEYPDYDINDVGRLNLTADNIMDFDKEEV